ncbi:MAG: 6-phosphofructokinase [Chitinophagales bacterium]|nr:6-phosphofructokinase [Chitinophagales bacterium]
MKNNFKTIAVMTSGGDASGMNAAIRAVVQTAVVKGIKVLAINGGYEGMIGGNFSAMNVKSFGNIIQKGGTIIYTSRSPALAQADVGIAVGSGSDIAAETAGIILVNSNPKDIASLILFGKATYRKMIQNIAWATGYNVIALPLAAGVLFKWGILLSPAAGAVLMSVSTIVVAINAKLLKVKSSS